MSWQHVAITFAGCLCSSIFTIVCIRVRARKAKNKHAGTFFIRESPIGIDSWFSFSCNLEDCLNAKHLIFTVKREQITQDDHEKAIDEKRTSIHDYI